MTFEAAKETLEKHGVYFRESEIHLFADLMSNIRDRREEGRAFFYAIEECAHREYIAGVRLKEDKDLVATALIAVEITEREVDTDPPVTVYNCVLWLPMGTWNETFGSRELLMAFLRGIKAVTFSVGLNVKWPERYEP